MAMPISAFNNLASQTPEHKRQHRFTVIVADDERTVHRCLELRYDIFANELGATLNTNTRKVDMDRFDPHSHHIAVIDNHTNEIVATTRILDNHGSQQTNGFYSETEFDLSNILKLDQRFCEVGRTCIHPEYRRGSALLMLWQGISRFVVENQIDFLFGCASIPFSNGDKYLNNVMRHLREKHFADESLRVTPRIPLRLMENNSKVDDVILPTLLKAYLRQGALICGDPYWDAAFGVADVFVLLDSNEISARYNKHFIERI